MLEYWELLWSCFYPNPITYAVLHLIYSTKQHPSSPQSLWPSQSRCTASHVITRNQIVTSGGLLSFSDDFNRAGTPIWTKDNIKFYKRALEGIPLCWNYQCSAEIDQKFSNRRKTTNSQSINQMPEDLHEYLRTYQMYVRMEIQKCHVSGITEGTIGKCTNGDSMVTTS